MTKSILINNHNDNWERLCIKGKDIRIIPESQGLTIISDFRDLNINLTIHNFYPDYLISSLIINNKTKKIEWFPVPGFMKVSGTIKTGENLLKIENVPVYIDHVFSGILPFNIPVKKMYWGRLLHPEIRISYSIAFSAKGKQWSRCFVMRGEQLITFPAVEYKGIKSMSDDPDSEQEDNNYQLVAREGLNSLLLEIHHQKIAAEGVFIDPDQFKNKNAYRIISKLSKNPRGKKYISVAKVVLEIFNQHYQWEKLVCIDEYVLF